MIPFLDLKAINAQYREELIAAATRVIDSGWYIQGQEVAGFEQEFATYYRALHRHCQRSGCPDADAQSLEGNGSVEGRG